MPEKLTHTVPNKSAQEDYQLEELDVLTTVGTGEEEGGGLILNLHKRRNQRQDNTCNLVY